MLSSLTTPVTELHALRLRSNCAGRALVQFGPRVLSHSFFSTSPREIGVFPRLKVREVAENASLSSVGGRHRAVRGKRLPPTVRIPPSAGHAASHGRTHGQRRSSVPLGRCLPAPLGRSEPSWQQPMEAPAGIAISLPNAPKSQARGTALNHCQLGRDSEAEGSERRGQPRRSRGSQFLREHPQRSPDPNINSPLCLSVAKGGWGGRRGIGRRTGDASSYLLGVDLPAFPSSYHHYPNLSAIRIQRGGNNGRAIGRPPSKSTQRRAQLKPHSGGSGLGVGGPGRPSVAAGRPRGAPAERSSSAFCHSLPAKAEGQRAARLPRGTVSFSSPRCATAQPGRFLT